MHSRTSIGLYAVVVCLLGAAPAFAQNLLTNPGFSAASQLGSWTTFGTGTQAWDASDAHGVGTSGSVHLSLAGAATQGTIVGVSQCVDISSQAALATYDYFASANGPGVAQSSESRAIVEVSFFTDTACTTAANISEGEGANVSAVPATSAPWQTFPGNASAGGNEGSATAPAGANGLLVKLYLEKTTANNPVQDIYLDEAVVHVQGTVPVTLMRFTAE